MTVDRRCRRPLGWLATTRGLSSDSRSGLPPGCSRPYEASLFRDLEYTFKNGLTYQVAYGSDEHYRQALALATELGMRPLAAHCHLGLGQLSRRTGDRPKTDEHLTTAATLYREMDMGYWLLQAQAALKDLGSLTG